MDDVIAKKNEMKNIGTDFYNIGRKNNSIFYMNQWKILILIFSYHLPFQIFFYLQVFYTNKNTKKKLLQLTWITFSASVAR